MRNLVSAERKAELAAVISQNENFWTDTYRRFDDLRAAREVVFEDGPESLTFRDRAYIVDRVTLEAERVFGEYRVFVRHPEDTRAGMRALLRDIVTDSELTSSADTALGMGLSFLGSDLSRQMLQIIKESPSPDPTANLFFWFS